MNTTIETKNLPGVKALLTEEKFKELISYFDLELFQFKPDRKVMYLDLTCKIEKVLEPGIMLYATFEEKFIFINLEIPMMSGGGRMDIYRDILTNEEYEELNENGQLPDIDHSNVARKLQSLGIEGPSLYWAGEIISEEAKFKSDEYSYLDEICLNRITFCGVEKQYYLEVKGDNYTQVGAVLMMMLSKNNITELKSPPRLMKTFFEILQKRKNKKQN